MGRGSRKFLYVIAIFTLAAAMLELGTRLIGSPFDEKTEPRELNQRSDELGQFARDVSECAGLGVRYYEYFLFLAAPCATATVNVGDFFSSRETPASQPADHADLIVWTFGGSTMQEYQTTDERSIANAIARTMAAAGIGVRVENFGATTFQSSMELVKFMTLAARVAPEQLPGVVVFYDGYNDANHGYYFGAGNVQNDLSAKLAVLVEHKSGRLSLYGASLGLAAVSAFWRTYVHRRLERALFHNPDPQPDKANLHRAVAIYLRNTRIAGGICAAIGARCFFVLQPLIATKTPLGPGEAQMIAAMKPSLIEFARRFYKGSRAAMQGNPAFIDASAVLNEYPEDVFQDLGHVSADGAPAVGEFIAGQILRRLDDHAPPGTVAGSAGALRTVPSP
jgi:hypothetical protein